MDILELVHEDRSSAARPFSCTEQGCHKSFARRSDLVRHGRIHSNDRPFACHYRGCNRSFIQRSALTVHLRVHTGERPHICEHPTCNKAFGDSSSLARHRRIHTGKRPYKCHVVSCQKTFCRRTTLTKHVKRNHPNSPTMGGFTFPYRIDRVRHSGSPIEEEDSEDEGASSDSDVEGPSLPPVRVRTPSRRQRAVKSYAEGDDEEDEAASRASSPSALSDASEASDPEWTPSGAPAPRPSIRIQGRSHSDVTVKAEKRLGSPFSTHSSHSASSAPAAARQYLEPAHHEMAYLTPPPAYGMWEARDTRDQRYHRQHPPAPAGTVNPGQVSRAGSSELDHGSPARCVTPSDQGSAMSSDGAHLTQFPMGYPTPRLSPSPGPANPHSYWSTVPTPVYSRTYIPPQTPVQVQGRAFIAPQTPRMGGQAAFPSPDMSPMAIYSSPHPHDMYAMSTSPSQHRPYIPRRRSSAVIASFVNEGVLDGLGITTGDDEHLPRASSSAVHGFPVPASPTMAMPQRGYHQRQRSSMSFSSPPSRHNDHLRESFSQFVTAHLDGDHMNAYVHHDR